jgi:putative flippase GtrA
MKTLMLKFPMLYQIIRYGVVGVLNNLLGYCIYLLVTFFWLDPKIAISVLYPIGATTAYFGHSKYSFSYQGSHTNAVLRYAFAHFVGYSVNVFMLFILSDKLKFPHQAVQALAIVVVAGILFLLFRYFVFPHSEDSKAIKP